MQFMHLPIRIHLITLITITSKAREELHSTARHNFHLPSNCNVHVVVDEAFYTTPVAFDSRAPGYSEHEVQLLAAQPVYH